MRHTVQCDVGGKTLTIESGWIAGQADGSVTRRYGGTGLGLAITSRLLEKLGSKLNISSELNKGSVFSFDYFFVSAKKILLDKIFSFKFNFICLILISFWKDSRN